MSEDRAGDGFDCGQVKSGCKRLAVATLKFKLFEIRRHAASQRSPNVPRLRPGVTKRQSRPKESARGFLFGSFQILRVARRIVAKLFQDFAELLGDFFNRDPEEVELHVA